LTTAVGPPPDGTLDRSLRARWRRVRGYYKSTALFRRQLAAPARALAYPPAALVTPGRTIEVQFRSGRQISLPLRQWALLPVLCRLDGIGAQTRILPDAKHVRVAGLDLYSPLWTRNEAEYYREVFIDDIYRIGRKPRQNAVVVDVGAYVGDSALAFARAGARVHAVEPAADLCGFITRNARANGMQDRVQVHAVGLGERSATVQDGRHTLRLVEGVEYTLQHLPRQIDVLKLDCEGAEYHLLADDRFLGHLRPREICMEFHQGPERVLPALAAAGYRCEMGPRHGEVGLLYATLAD